MGSSSACRRGAWLRSSGLLSPINPCSPRNDAAWGEELASKPLARRLLDTPIALYRRDDGHPVALLDRCPRRFAPLSIWRVVGTQIHCGYQGMKLESNGSSVDSRFTGGARIAAL